MQQLKNIKFLIYPENQEFNLINDKYNPVISS